MFSPLARKGSHGRALSARKFLAGKVRNAVGKSCEAREKLRIS